MRHIGFPQVDGGQWDPREMGRHRESARLEVEARFVRECKLSPHLFQHQSKQGPSDTAVPITYSLASPTTLDAVNAWHGLWSSDLINERAVSGDYLFKSSPTITLGLGDSVNSMEKAETD